MFFGILDEVNSFMLEENMQRYLPDVAANATAVEELTGDPDFQESNLMHTMNG